MHTGHTRGEKFQCGIDEAGRGPVIGPMIISIVCGDRDLFADLGVRDSKELSPSRRKALSKQIILTAKYYRRLEISAADLNVLMETKTLNEIEADAASELLKGAMYETYVDCFDVNEQRGSRTLSADSPVEVHCMHDADKYVPAVSAASILSKVMRDEKVAEIERVYGEIGSGYPSDPRTVNFLESALRSGKDLDVIVRKKWKTYTSLKRKIDQGDLYDF